MSAGASAGAAAAAEAERKRREEEEMTGCTGKELSGDWEFKIIRSNMGAFRNPEKLQAALEQEKRGGLGPCREVRQPPDQAQAAGSLGSAAWKFTARPGTTVEIACL